jgi:hypothetical protein
MNVELKNSVSRRVDAVLGWSGQNGIVWVWLAFVKSGKGKTENEKPWLD